MIEPTIPFERRRTFYEKLHSLSCQVVILCVWSLSGSLCAPFVPRLLRGPLSSPPKQPLAWILYIFMLYPKAGRSQTMHFYGVSYAWGVTNTAFISSILWLGWHKHCIFMLYPMCGVSQTGHFYSVSYGWGVTTTAFLSSIL